MSLTVTEANEINWVIEYWLEMDTASPVTDERVLDAMAHLADQANKKLMAGTSGAKVRQRWAELTSARKPAPASSGPKKEGR